MHEGSSSPRLVYTMVVPLPRSNAGGGNGGSEADLMRRDREAGPRRGAAHKSHPDVVTAEAPPPRHGGVRATLLLVTVTTAVGIVAALLLRLWWNRAAMSIEFRVNSRPRLGAMLVVPADRVCSHRGAATADTPAPVTLEQHAANVRALLSAGVRCWDLDVSLMGSPALGPSQSLRIGHPTEASLLHSPDPASYIRSVRELAGAQLSDAGPLVITLEPKFLTRTATNGSPLSSDWRPMEPLEATEFVQTVHSFVERVAAISPSSSAPLQLAYIVKEADLHLFSTAIAAASTRSDGGVAPHPCIALPVRDADGCSFAPAALAAADVLMPSVACWRRPVVAAAIAQWRRDRAATSHAAGAVFSSPDGSSSDGAAAFDDVLVWLVDDCATAKEVLMLGSDHVRSGTSYGTRPSHRSSALLSRRTLKRLRGSVGEGAEVVNSGGARSFYRPHTAAAAVRRRASNIVDGKLAADGGTGEGGWMDRDIVVDHRASRVISNVPLALLECAL